MNVFLIINIILALKRGLDDGETGVNVNNMLFVNRESGKLNKIVRNITVRH